MNSFPDPVLIHLWFTKPRLDYRDKGDETSILSTADYSDFSDLAMATNARDPHSAPVKVVHREIFREVMKTFIDYNDAVFNIIENQMDITDETSIRLFVTKVRKDPACQALLSLLNSGSLTAMKLFDALRQSEPSKDQSANHPATTSADIALPPQTGS